MGIFDSISKTMTSISSNLIPASRQPWKSVKQKMEQYLLMHFQSLGIEVCLKTWAELKTRRREGNEKVTLRKLANLDIQMGEVSSIEVWRQTRKQGSVSVTFDELSYVIMLKPNISISRIPILTSTAIPQTTDDKAFEWVGFTWGKLPLLVERLKVDTPLNNKLQKLFDVNMLTELRIRALYEDKIEIVSDYDSQKLPPRELLDCIEDIAKHVISYITEQNEYRDHQDKITRQKLFGPHN